MEKIIPAVVILILMFLLLMFRSRIHHAKKEISRLRAGRFTGQEVEQLQKTSGFWNAVSDSLEKVKQGLTTSDRASYEPGKVIGKALSYFDVR